MFSATARMRSGSPTEVPPYFWTMSATGWTGYRRTWRLTGQLASPIVLGRFLDDSFAPEVRSGVTTLTVARLSANSCYRYSAPFLATIARGLDVSLEQVGVALAI